MKRGADLQRLYDLALLRRGASDRPDIPVETVHQLAAGTYLGEGRIELLDRVLEDPVLATELDFFAEVASAAPGSRQLPAGRARWALPLAATLAVVAGGTLLWSAFRPGGEDAMRGERSAVTLVAPGAALQTGAALAWRSVGGADSYRVEVIDAAGTLVLQAEGPDTTATIPASTTLVPGAEYSWWVTARLADGRQVNSAVARVTAR